MIQFTYFLYGRKTTEVLPKRPPFESCEQIVSNFRDRGPSSALQLKKDKTKLSLLSHTNQNKNMKIGLGRRERPQEVIDKFREILSP